MYWSRSTVALLSNELWRKGVLTFETREELIDTIADILAFKYCQDLKFWRCTAMDDLKEMEYWSSRIKQEVEPYREAVKNLLNREANKRWLGIFPRKKIKIDYNHRILLRKALKLINQRDTSICGIATNVTIIIDLNQNRILQITRSNK